MNLLSCPRDLGARCPGADQTHVVGLYTPPPPGATVVCADELGPVSPRTFALSPGWSVDGHRIKAPLEYSRGPDKIWVYGSIRVRDGQAVALTASSRNSVNYVFYVMATRCDHRMTTRADRTARADELVAEFADRSWQRLSVGAGAHGPREYDWARRQIDGAWVSGRGHWLLARRSISDPTEIAYYLCYGPASARLVDLAWTAGSRWHVEEAFQHAKGEAGLDRYQVRKWRAWYAHIALSMAADPASTKPGTLHRTP